MPVNIIEIKAKCVNASPIRKILQSKNADFKGIDHQIDTYFNARSGRLKLREGNIENTLIHYDRPNQAGPKNSQVTYRRLPPNTDLKAVLTAAMGAIGNAIGMYVDTGISEPICGAFFVGLTSISKEQYNLMNLPGGNTYKGMTINEWIPSLTDNGIVNLVDEEFKNEVSKTQRNVSLGTLAVLAGDLAS